MPILITRVQIRIGNKGKGDIIIIMFHTFVHSHLKVEGAWQAYELGYIFTHTHMLGYIFLMGGESFTKEMYCEMPRLWGFCSGSFCIARRKFRTI